MTYVWLAVIAVLVINAVVTILLVRSSTFTGKQKIMQAVLVWSLPVIGAVTCLYFLTEPQNSKHGNSTAEVGYTDNWLAGSDNPSEHHRG